MSNVRATVRCNWFGGLLIGLMPLLAHAALEFFATPLPGYGDNWVPDMLFITISNSGFAALSVFVKSGFGDHPFRKFSPGMILLWVILLLSFAGAAMLYGVEAIGHGRQNTWEAAAVLIVTSCICSYNFEMAMIDT